MIAWQRWLCLLVIIATPFLSLMVLISLWPMIPVEHDPRLASDLPGGLQQQLLLSQTLDRLHHAQVATVQWGIWITMAVALGIQFGWTGFALIQGTLARRLREGVVMTILCVIASSLPWIVQAGFTDPLFVLFLQTMPAWLVWITFIGFGGLLHAAFQRGFRGVRWLLREARTKDWESRSWFSISKSSDAWKSGGNRRE